MYLHTCALCVLVCCVVAVAVAVCCCFAAAVVALCTCTLHTLFKAHAAHDRPQLSSRTIQLKACASTICALPPGGSSFALSMPVVASKFQAMKGAAGKGTKKKGNNKSKVMSQNDLTLQMEIQQYTHIHTYIHTYGRTQQQTSSLLVVVPLVYKVQVLFVVCMIFSR